MFVVVTKVLGHWLVNSEMKMMKGGFIRELKILSNELIPYFIGIIINRMPCRTSTCITICDGAGTSVLRDWNLDLPWLRADERTIIRRA